MVVLWLCSLGLVLDWRTQGVKSLADSRVGMFTEKVNALS